MVPAGTPSEAARDASALALLSYGFENFARETPVHAGQVLARVSVKGQPKLHPRLIATSTYTHIFPRSARIRVRVSAPVQLIGPVPPHTVVGSAVILDGRRVQARIPLELVSAVPTLRTSKGPGRVVVLSATLSGLVRAAAAAIGLRMFWRELSRG